MNSFQPCYEYTCSIIHVHTRAIQGRRRSASPRTGPEACQGKGEHGAGPEKGLTPRRGGGHVNHSKPLNIRGIWWNSGYAR